MHYARVILDFPALKLFDYIIPPEFKKFATPGTLVLVSVERRLTTGLIFEITEKSDFKSDKIKPIVKVFSDFKFISNSQLKLIRWISDYYVCGYGEAARLLYPNGIAVKSYQWIQLSVNSEKIILPKGSNQRKILKLLNSSPMTFSALTKKMGAKNIRNSLASLEKSGHIKTERRLHSPKVKPKLESVFNLSAIVDTKLTNKQKIVVELLNNGPLNKREIINKTGVSDSVLSALVKKEIIQVEKKEVYRNYSQHYEVPHPVIRLNPFQLRAVSAINSSLDKGIFKVFLIHGITGSGKTQVYIEVIKQVLLKGKGIICLIPEISLTPQTVARFQNNFGKKIAVLHSRLSNGERFDMWRQVGSGEIKVVVGARSALFAPVKDLGLIIIDEEHEHTYKQSESRPLYHARSVASVRARSLKIPVVLGSATPSIETFYNAQIEKYELLSLPSRAAGHMQIPNISVIDLRKTSNMGSSDNIISDLLLDKIENRLYAGEQILLLQNRRGYSTFIECTVCGHVEQCAHCAVSLSLHATDNTLRCHFCGYTKSVTRICNSCGSDKLDRKGIGTQKVEKILEKKFPEAVIERMDYDTTSGKKGHEKILTRFEKREIDILVGTQMIAKGLDFPNVTLVGVILADVGFYLPDFRSSEKMFQLLTQVSGRSGRGKIPGEVVIQTYNPDHPIIDFVKHQDFQNYYVKELNDRKALNYPPFMWLALIRVESSIEKDCPQILEQIKSFIQLETKASEIDILGPAPSAFSKIKDLFRWQLLIKVDQDTDKNAANIIEVLRKLFHNKKSIVPDRARLVIDIDPHMVL